MARPSTRRQRRREARREEILEAAMHIVVAEGLDALTVARLAKELDAAIGALYRYFPGKEALLAALQAQALAELHADMQRELEMLEGPVHDDPRVDALVRLLVVLRPHIEGPDRAPARHRLVDELLSSAQILLQDDDALVGVEPILQAVCDRFEVAVRSGALRPESCLVRTHVMWAAVHGLDHFRKRDRLQADPALKTRALLPELFRTLFAGWGADASVLDATFERFETLRAG